VTSRIDIADRQTDLELNHDHLARLGAFLLDRLGAGGRISVAFLPDDEMSRLNREYLGADGSTDVIAFPLGDAIAPEDVFGEVVVCTTQAMRQAREHDQEPGVEVDRLVIHGILHLLGRRDATAGQRTKMLAEGEQLLAEFFEKID
jgi:rRNA maturation RNase YbeY